MRDAQQPGHISLNTLIGRIKDGRYVIPDFQREFEWEARDIRDLIRSIFRDYYIGSLLLWKGTPENFDALSCEPIYGHVGSAGRELIVLDGQQRLTALNYAFVAPECSLPGRATRALFFVHLDRFVEEDADDAFDYRWDDRSWKVLAETPEKQFANHIFPMSVIGKGGFALANWAQGYEGYWKKRQESATQAGNNIAEAEAARHVANAITFSEVLRATTELYQVSFVELDRALEVDKICNIFTQINSKGVRLDIFDLINAMLKPKGLQLKNMWREARGALGAPEIDKLNVYVLQVMSIHRQVYCSPKYLYFLLPGQSKPVRDPDGTRRHEVLVADALTFERDWRAAVEALDKALRMLLHPQEFGVTKTSFLPYKTILPVFAALQMRIGQMTAERKLDAQRKFRTWYWSSVFTNHYSASSESTSARDFTEVLAWIDDGPEPPPVARAKAEMSQLPLETEVKPSSSRYNGVFNLFVLGGAKDWITGTIPQAGDIHDHHVIPRSWGMKQPEIGERINSILNRCPLTAETNCSVIADRLPNAYLPELIAKNGEDKVRAVLESHLISPAALAILLRDPFTPKDFDDFIEERKLTIIRAIEARLLDQHQDLPPELRALDSQIERVEIGLRSLVAHVLDDDFSLLPGDVRQKIQDRLKSIERNPIADSTRYVGLAGKLEFGDLRELQAIVTNGNLWPRFEPLFGPKPGLDVKFGQLANLRNGIRHSRHVDQVTSMEGSAAVLWFGQLLSKHAEPSSGDLAEEGDVTTTSVV